MFLKIYSKANKEIQKEHTKNNKPRSKLTNWEKKNKELHKLDETKLMSSDACKNINKLQRAQYI